MAESAQEHGGGAREWRAGSGVVLAAAVAQAFGTMHLYSLGLVVVPLEREFGWSRAEISSGYLIVSVLSVVGVPLVGRLMDRIGPRRIAIPGMSLLCLGVAGLSLAGPSIWSWWALWLFLSLGCMCASTAIWTAAVASRFDKSRGLAIAAVMFGSGVCSAIVPLATYALIAGVGWRGTYVVMAATAAIVTLPLLYFFFYGAADLVRTGRRAAEPDGGRSVSAHQPGAILSGRFVRLAIANFAILLASISLVINFVPIVQSVGMTTSLAAGAATLIGFGSITGRCVTGLLLDRMHGTIVGAVSFALPASVSLIILWFGGNTYAIYPAAFILGLSLGSEVDVIAYLASRYFDMAKFGTVFSILIAIQIITGGVGPFVGSLIYDNWGSYEPLLIGTIPVFALAALLVGTLGPYRR